MSTTENTTAVRTPSKKARATEIFVAKLTERAQGLFGSNKEFRAAVLNEVMAELGVTAASAATMYNTAKAEAEAADPTLGLGRDPKKVKVPGTGRRGRPAGSKNKEKTEVVETTDDQAPAADAEPVSA